MRSSTVTLRLALAFAATLALAACSSSESSSSTTSTSTGDGGATDGSASTASGPQIVTVTYAGSAKPVDVTTLATQDYKGEPVVALSKIWEAAKLTGELTKLEFDFEGDDGFHPTSRPRCTALVPGAQIAQGYVLPATRSLVWDDALGLAGCYAVKGVAKVIATDKK